MDAALDISLKTPRLTLRQMTRKDAGALCRIVTQPQVGRMLFLFPPDWTVSAAELFIDRWQFRGPLKLRLAICDGQGRMIGSVGALRHDGQVELFYFLDPGAAGHGYATEAMHAFAAFLFDRFGLHELHADVFTDNPASMRVLGKIGFEKTGEAMGTSAARLEPAPVYLYRLTKSQFEAAT